ncbi:hypothetical protein TKK_0001375 [Trichogramma kaykai]
MSPGECLCNEKSSEIGNRLSVVCPKDSEDFIREVRHYKCKVVKLANEQITKLRKSKNDDACADTTASDCGGSPGKRCACCLKPCEDDSGIAEDCTCSLSFEQICGDDNLLLQLYTKALRHPAIVSALFILFLTLVYIYWQICHVLARCSSGCSFCLPIALTRPSRVKVF